MKLLYVLEVVNVNDIENQILNFHAVEIVEETEDEYILSDRIHIENYAYNFPKSCLNKEFKYGFVMKRKNTKILEKQMKRLCSEMRGYCLYQMKKYQHKLESYELQ